MFKCSHLKFSRFKRNNFPQWIHLSTISSLIICHPILLHFLLSSLSFFIFHLFTSILFNITIVCFCRCWFWHFLRDLFLWMEDDLSRMVVTCCYYYKKLMYIDVWTLWERKSWLITENENVKKWTSEISTERIEWTHSGSLITRQES